MKISNEVIFAAKSSIDELLKTNLPVKCAWQIAMLTGKLTPALTAIETTKDGLVKKYGQPDKNGNISIDQSSPNWNDFVSEFNVLFSQEVEIVFDKIELPQQVDGKDLQMKPEILIALKDFVTIK
jgi:hypothetical protein